MTTVATIKNENNRLMVSGDLNFLTMTTLLQQATTLLGAARELHFDFSQVTSANSAGLALLVEWIKYAKKVNKPLHFSNIPPQLLTIAKAGGIEKLLSSFS